MKLLSEALFGLWLYLQTAGLLKLQGHAQFNPDLPLLFLLWLFSHANGEKNNPRVEVFERNSKKSCFGSNVGLCHLELDPMTKEKRAPDLLLKLVQ